MDTIADPTETAGPRAPGARAGGGENAPADAPPPARSPRGGSAAGVGRIGGFSLTGGAGLASEAVDRLLNPHYAAYALAAGITQPILDGGALEGQLDVEKGKAREALDLDRKQALSAFADVEGGLVGVQQGAEKLRADRDALVWARKAYDAALLQLKAGTIDIVTLATNENAYYQAEDAVARARSAYEQAAVTLHQALGGGWTLDVETARAGEPGADKT